jgi:hypothetical protein
MWREKCWKFREFNRWITSFVCSHHVNLTNTRDCPNGTFTVNFAAELSSKIATFR